MPMHARIVLCGTLVGTSSMTTALIGWVGAPYVSKMRQRDEGEVLEMETSTLLLQKRVTRVYDWRVFLKGTGRAFAKWELAKEVTGTAGREGEETVAETENGAGKVIGRWIVRWDANGTGKCRGEGKIVRSEFPQSISALPNAWPGTLMSMRNYCDVTR